uniref:STAS domain-containing protein n=1 Tax=Derxia lacustris TaxID=764842 RepID=UPI001594DB23|nr:STAS domain-containing protein [Derxia lacustris]
MTTRLALPAELTIYMVAELAPQWLASLDGLSHDDAADDSFAVDAAAVAEVDAAGLQLLVALANQLTRDGWTLRLARPSPTLAQACALLGLDALLGAGAAA